MYLSPVGEKNVPLDKRPGFRPIGVGEALQRSCAKTMLLVTGVVL